MTAAEERIAALEAEVAVLHRCLSNVAMRTARLMIVTGTLHEAAVPASQLVPERHHQRHLQLVEGGSR
jgi:hypothetical protein